MILLRNSQSGIFFSSKNQAGTFALLLKCVTFRHTSSIVLYVSLCAFFHSCFWRRASNFWSNHFQPTSVWFLSSGYKNRPREKRFRSIGPIFRKFRSYQFSRWTSQPLISLWIWISRILVPHKMAKDASNRPNFFCSGCVFLPWAQKLHRHWLEMIGSEVIGLLSKTCMVKARKETYRTIEEVCRNVTHSAGSANIFAWFLLEKNIPLWLFLSRNHLQ